MNELDKQWARTSPDYGVSPGTASTLRTAGITEAWFTEHLAGDWLDGSKPRQLTLVEKLNPFRRCRAVFRSCRMLGGSVPRALWLSVRSMTTQHTTRCKVL